MDEKETRKDVAAPPKEHTITEHQYRVFLLGQFCLAFAATEMHLHHAVQELTGVNTDVFRAIFSGLRVDASIQNIKRLLQANDVSEEIRTAYAEIFTHIGFLLEARNLMLHYGVTLDHVKREVISTNKRVALTATHEKTLPFSAEILQHLIHDTQKANAHLLVEQQPRQKELMKAALREILLKPWRYIPPKIAQPKPPQHSERGRRQQKAPKGPR
jgi:hypothetical protein